MSGLRIVVVDDSPFSIAVIRGILEQNGYEVVGEAGTLDEVKAVIQEVRPALVTMDMTLPGTDGLECTRAIHEIDRTIRVIVISSMMDDEIVKAARDNHVSAYVQKPVDEDVLINAIRRVTSHDEMFLELQQSYAAAIKEALLDGMNRMTKTLLTYQDDITFGDTFQSRGMTIIISIIGQFSGRLLLDLSMETAAGFVTAILRREPKNPEEIAAALAEFTNIVAGNACSALNRQNKALGLRLAPPSVMRGDNMLISHPDFDTITSVATTNYGEILMNAGFKRGEEKWM